MRIGLTGLVQIEFPEYTVRLCDGAFFPFEGNTFRSEDAVFGTLGSVEPLSEGVGDSVPALQMTLLPPEGTPPATLSQPGYQTSRVRFWIAEFDADTGQITSADIQFDGQVDQTVLEASDRDRKLIMSVVSLAERLFEGNLGNTLNPTFHKSIWPGERGHDNATGLAIPVAWGTEGPGSGGSSRGSGGGGGLGGESDPRRNSRL